MNDYLSVEILGLVTVYQLLLIVHLLGLALGAGAAFFSDFLFTSILRDRKINSTEYGILKLASTVVWIGLSVLFVSGVLIFLGDSERLLDSSKFLAKMTILCVLFINGLAFHFVHLPALGKLVNKDLSKSKQFKDTYATPFFIGGAVSGVSWTAALVLGSLDFIDLSYVAIITIYVLVLLLMIPVALKLKDHILRPSNG